jgi:alkylation response protein AidB-like acyl-CoA dehydrogenase
LPAAEKFTPATSAVDDGGGDPRYMLRGPAEQVRGPGYLGEELLGPRLIAFGTQEQQRRFLPAIKAVDELWCQGYFEPGTGSDLAAVATTARLDGGQWVITGQKVWTSPVRGAGRGPSTASGSTRWRRTWPPTPSWPR